MEWMRCFLQAAMQGGWGPCAPPLAFFLGASGPDGKATEPGPSDSPPAGPPAKPTRLRFLPTANVARPLLAAGVSGSYGRTLCERVAKPPRPTTPSFTSGSDQDRCQTPGMLFRRPWQRKRNRCEWRAAWKRRRRTSIESMRDIRPVRGKASFQPRARVCGATVSGRRSPFGIALEPGTDPGSLQGIYETQFRKISLLLSYEMRRLGSTDRQSRRRVVDVLHPHPRLADAARA